MPRTTVGVLGDFGTCRLVAGKKHLFSGFCLWKCQKLVSYIVYAFVKSESPVLFIDLSKSSYMFCLQNCQNRTICFVYRTVECEPVRVCFVHTSAPQI